MFPACCFRQRTYMAQGLFNWVLNETWTLSCFQHKWLLSGQTCLYRGPCSSFLECVYFETKSIWPKMNVITRLEFELTYYDSAVYCFNHNYTRTSLPQMIKWLQIQSMGYIKQNENKKYNFIFTGTSLTLSRWLKHFIIWRSSPQIRNKSVTVDTTE